MSNAVLSSEAGRGNIPDRGPAVAAALAIWLGLVTVLAARGAFEAPPGAIPIALIAGVTVPVMGFFLAYRSWRSVRDFVVTADLRLLAAIQAWRFLGFGFVALHANGVLPGLFAWPAGIGDMAVAIVAPWIAVGLARRPDFLTMRRFKWWNWLGILDLILAVGTGALASGLVPGLVRDGITTAPMARLPLVLVPAFLVPLMIMSHAIGLLQARNVADRSRAT